MLVLNNYSFAQETDSIKTKKSLRSSWLNKPQSGKSEKTQGGFIMVAGASSVLTGIILLNEKDPCDDIQTGFCISNVDEVHTTGAITIGMGLGAIIYGIIRYSDGVRKAKAYEKWKSSNKLSFKPQIKFSNTHFEIGFISFL